MKLKISILIAFLFALVQCRPVPDTHPDPGGQQDDDSQEPGDKGGEPENQEKFTTVEDHDGESITLRHGVKGDPAVVGCADGTREAFHDLKAFPTIAGCIGNWEGTKSLRDAPTGKACGDGLGNCEAPADVCAPGWHICSRDGFLRDMQRVTAEQCREKSGAGRFVAAISHCKTQSGCQYESGDEAVYDCFNSGWCSEPVCCGEHCGMGACPSGIWEEQTYIAQGTDQGCSAMTSTRAGGILCCKD